MKILSPDASGFKLPPEGEHEVSLVSYEDLGHRPDPFNEGETKHEVKLVFQLDTGEKQYAWFRASLNPKSTLHGVVTALLGTNPPAALEMDELVGKRCIIEVEHSVDGKGRIRSKVMDYRRVRGK